MGWVKREETIELSYSFLLNWKIYIITSNIHDLGQNYSDAPRQKKY